jgi:formamidopyrimidine-DNA glycosylase
VPELPEVETIRSSLERRVVGRRIDEIRILDSRLTRPASTAEVEGRLRAERIDAVVRRGKYLVLTLSGGAHLLVHLRMTGSFQLGRNGSLGEDPHRRAVVTLDDGSDVAYRDVRRFGTWVVLDGPELDTHLASRLGPEPLGRGFTTGRLERSLAGRRVGVKAVILDQRVAAGVGNIYADEALWRAGIHPARPAGELGADELARLRRAIRATLRTGIARQGATLRDFRDPSGSEGRMQDEFEAYGRDGEACSRCGDSIVKTRVAGRGTWYCPRCQPLDPAPHPTASR